MILNRLSLITILLQLFLASVAMAEGDAQSREPTEIKHDWVQLTSGEWLSGKIHAMYNDKLEFDSEKLKLLTIDWEDVNRLQSYQIFLVNIDEDDEQARAIKGRPLRGALSEDDVYTGTLSVSGSDVTITTAEGTKSFDRADLISFAPGGEGRIDLWAAKVGLSLNVQEGNTQQIDYTAKANAIRRTAKTRLILDYIGNVSATGSLSTGSTTTTVENHRVNVTSNIYVTRSFFYTPFEGEYYRDPFRNIDRRITLGAGLGYVVIDKKELTWEVSGGPSFLNTRYISVQQGESASDSSFALMLGTLVETDITKTLEFTFQYDIKAAQKKAGGYSHHAIASFENEITKRIDLDVSLLWDRTSYPTADANGVVPKADDYRFMLGFNYSFN
jgi:putative salt-induced outer membrane protein YdiY